MIEDDDLEWREKLVLKEFKGGDVLRYRDLPPWLGRRTMAALVERGLIRLIIEARGKRSTGGAWQLVN